MERGWEGMQNTELDKHSGLYRGRREHTGSSCKRSYKRSEDVIGQKIEVFRDLSEADGESEMRALQFMGECFSRDTSRLRELLSTNKLLPIDKGTKDEKGELKHNQMKCKMERNHSTIS
jgi:hypothetical protein